MPDVTTFEIQNRITGLKAELDRLSLQLESSQWARTATDGRSVPAVSAMQPERDALGPDEPEGSLRTLRDLMWQGRWGLAFHLARALETQGVVKSDFPSSTIRMWALAQDGRRHEAESLRLAQELLQDSGSAANPELAPRLLEWAIRIAVVSGVDASQLEMLSEGFQPPEELPATGEWWRNYVASLGSAPKNAGKWVRLPDPEKPTSEVDELMLRDEREPVRLAASCLMMSIRRAMRHVHALSTADERYILNAELARATTVSFAENGDVCSEAADLERAVCEIARSLPGEQTVVMKEVVGTTVDHCRPLASMMAKADERPLEPDAGEQSRQKSTTVPTGQVRQSTARERLDRYAQRVAIQNSAKPVERPNQLAALTKEEERVAAPSTASLEAGSSVAGPASSPSAARESAVSDPSGSAETEERVERRRIHEAALANAFSLDTASVTARSGEGASSWGMMLFNPQAAIVAGLLVIAGAVIVGLGTGLAAKDIAEATTPANEGVELPSEFAGDLPAVD